MSSSVPGGLRSSASLRIQEELMGGEKQGIGSILGFSRQRTEKRESLRRTFSADMSSKKWLGQNLPLSLKKIASTQEFSTMSASVTSSASSSTASEGEEEKEEPSQFDIWSSIQSKKTSNPDSLSNNTYIHPLVKRSLSSLSEKSLEICTESLGSETGSDGFSSSEDYFPSDSSDEEEEVVQDEMQDCKKELVAVNYNCSISRKSPPRSFPPPLPSISRRDGPSLQMRPLRKDGRLVVEAIPVPSHNYLHAQRVGGRLRLSFINSPPEVQSHIHSQQEEAITEAKEEEVENSEDEIEVVVDRGIVLEVKLAEEGMRVGKKSMLVMNKRICGMHAMHLNNSNPWVDRKIDGGDEARRVSPLLSSASINGYDLYWKRGPMAHHTKQSPPNNNKLIVSNKPLVFRAEDFLPVMRCNEPRRPAMVRELFCIATT